MVSTNYLDIKYLFYFLPHTKGAAQAPNPVAYILLVASREFGELAC